MPSAPRPEHPDPAAADRPPPAAERIPATVVTGFLGSGKTTLVNRILANQQGLRAAVIVNEFGAIGIDGDLVVAAENDVVELSNGCICCSLNGDLVAAIGRLRARAGRIDYLVVETTGLADPLPVALTLVRPEFRGVFRLDSILSVVDAENFAPDLCAGPAALNQLRYGDVILLNKADLVGAARLGEVEAGLRALGVVAPVLPAVRAEVPLALLVGIGGGPPDIDAAASPDAPTSGLGKGYRHGPAEADGHGHAGHHASHAEDHATADGFSSVSFASDRPFAVEAFQAFLEDAGRAGVYRGKGILWMEGSETEFVFHLVGRRFSLDERPPGARRRNRLVLIGRGLDAADLRRRLGGCLADAAPPASG